MIQLVIRCVECSSNLLPPSDMAARKGGDVRVIVHPTVLTTVCPTCGKRPLHIGLDVTIRHVSK